MGSEFDYTNVETDDEKARAVAAEMSGGGLAPLTEQQIAERQEWLAEHRARIEQERIDAEQHRLEREHQRAAKEAAERRSLALAAQRERAAEIEHLTTRRSLSDLHFQSAQQTGWQRDITRAMQNQAAYQARQTLLSELEAMVNPPAAPEPTVVVVEADQEDDTFCGVKITRPNPRRSWW
jgi:hypothetical protein